MKINPRYSKFFIEHKKLTSDEDNTVWVVDYEYFEEFFEVLKEDEDIDVLTKGLIALLATGGLRISEALNLKRKDFEYDQGRLFGLSEVLKKKFLVRYYDILEYRQRELDYKNASEEKLKLYEDVFKKWLHINRKKQKSQVKLEFSELYAIKKEELVQSLAEVYSENDIIRVIDTFQRTYERVKKNPPKEVVPKRYFVVHGFLTEIVEDLWKRRIIGRRMPKPSDYLFKFSRQEALRKIKRALGSEITNHSMRHSHVSYLLFKLKKTTEEVSEITRLHRDTVKNYQHYNTKRELLKIY